MVGLLCRICTVNQKKPFRSVLIAQDRGQMNQRYHGSCICHTGGSQLVTFVHSISYHHIDVLTTAHLLMCLPEVPLCGYLCA